MWRTMAVVVVFAVAAATGGTSCSGSSPSDELSPESTPATTGPGPCIPSTVHYGPYPGKDRRLSRIPWIQGEPAGPGLVGLLWYWPENWRKRRIQDSRIFTQGIAPGGYTTKILWAFVSRSARDSGGSELVVEGRRLDGAGTFRQSFAAISYAGQAGAPSYASIVEVPEPGCWRLEVSTAELRASVVLRAVPGGAGV
jgi:hypothetical protein